MDKITIERETLEQFRDDVLHQRGPLAENGMTSDQINDVLGLFDDAFAATLAADASVKESFTVAEQSMELDAGMAAQHYCRRLWGAARGHPEWRKVHEHFSSGYKQGRHEALRAALAAHPAEAQQEPVRDIIEGWKSATFGWNGTNPISYEKARADHAEECIRRIEAALTAQPAECGNTPYDEGPFTLAAQPADYAIGYADGFRDACKPARRIYMTAQPAPAATDINMPLPEPDGELTLRIIGREVQVDAYRTSTLIDYARDYAAAEVAKERERAAKAAEDFLTRGRSPLGRSVAAAIRAGSASTNPPMPAT